ncbi:MAG: outer membrane beta-barrel protein [Gemmatimonadaceae bacterium]
MFRLSKFAAAFAIAAASAATAGAQALTTSAKPYSLGIAGGAAIPTGNLSSTNGLNGLGANTGYNVTGSLGIASPRYPISLRGDVAYNNFGLKNSAAKYHVWSGTANAVYSLPAQAVARPYLIGGLGAYRPNSTAGNVKVSGNTKLGFDVGGGIIVPLYGLNAFIESRYNQYAVGNGRSMNFVHVTFGVMF